MKSMNCFAEPVYEDDQAYCVRNYPAMRAPLEAGDFQPWHSEESAPDSDVRPQWIAKYRFPDSSEACLFYVQPCAFKNRWYAWGDYCRYGRSASDACYDFLNGGGSFSTRSAAEWAIHAFVAELNSCDHSKSS